MSETRKVEALEGIRDELFEIREALARIEDKLPSKEIIEQMQKALRTIAQRAP